MGRVSRLSPASKTRSVDRLGHEDVDVHVRDKTRKTSKNTSGQVMTEPPTKLSKGVKPNTQRGTRETLKRPSQVESPEARVVKSRRTGKNQDDVGVLAKKPKTRVKTPANREVHVSKQLMKGGTMTSQTKQTTTKRGSKGQSDLRNKNQKATKRSSSGEKTERHVPAKIRKVVKPNPQRVTKKTSTKAPKSKSKSKPPDKKAVRMPAKKSKSKAKTTVIRVVSNKPKLKGQAVTTNQVKKFTTRQNAKSKVKTSTKKGGAGKLQRGGRKGEKARSEKATGIKDTKVVKTKKVSFGKLSSRQMVATSNTKKKTVAGDLKGKGKLMVEPKTSNTKKRTVTGEAKQKGKLVDKPKKATNKSGLQVKGKKVAKHPNSRLTPNLNIKVVDKDPMFEVKNEKEIPKVSDYVNCKRAIRAVLTKDNALLKKLINNTKEIPSLFVRRSVCLQDDALDYALKTENTDALKLLIAEKYYNHDKPRKAMPDQPYPSDFTGYSKPCKEGNGALTKDTECEDDIQNIVRFDKALNHGVSIDAISLLAEGSGCDCTGMIHRAVRAGHHKLASQMMKKVKGRRGNGFIKLHEEVLSATKPEQLTSFKAEVVTKKSYKNQRITPLHCAAINPNPKIIAKLLTVSPDVSFPDQAGFTPIHYAAACKSSGPLELLLKSGVDAETPQPKKLVTPLMIAAKHGRTKNVEVLLKKRKPISASDPHPTPPKRLGVTRIIKSKHFAIHYAAEGGHVDCVRSLVKYGDAVDMKTSHKNNKLTPLMIAAERGHLQLAKVLIEELDAEIEKRDRFKRTSLMLACMNGHYPVATLLLRKGANPNAKDSSGNSPVHYAAAYGWWHCLKLLLQAGGDPNILNTDELYNTQITPLGAAYMKGHFGCAELLLGHPGININRRNDECETLLLTACSKSTTEESLRQLKLFVENGADIHASDLHGRTPFRVALKNGMIDLLKFFLSKNANIPLDEDIAGDNLLHFIAGSRIDAYDEIFKLLIENEKTRDCKGGKRTQRSKGSKVTTLKEAARRKNNEGCTPLLKCITDHLNWKFCGRHKSIECPIWNAVVKALINLCESDINAVVEKDLRNVPRNSCALHMLASKEPSNVFSTIMAMKPKLDVVNAEGYTPLLCAIVGQQAQNVITLLAAGADPNCSDKHNALLLAIKNNMPGIVPDLLAKGADIHGSVFENKQPSIMHHIPVYIKDSEAQVSVAEQLVSAGASLHTVDDQMRNVLHAAVNKIDRKGSTTFVEFLLDHKLDVFAADELGRLPIHYAFTKYGAFGMDKPVMDSTTQSFDPKEAVSLLATAMQGKKLNQQDKLGRTPLHHAAEVGALDSIPSIFEGIDDLDIKDKDGCTPLSMAMVCSRERVAKWLIDKGANINQEVFFCYGKADKRARTTVLKEVVREDWHFIILAIMDKIASGGVPGISYLDALEDILEGQKFQLADDLIYKLPKPDKLQMTNDKGQNLLHLLAIHAVGGSDIQDKTVLFLLDNGVKLFATDYRGCTPLHYAAVNMNASFCKIFEEKDPVSFQSCIMCTDQRGRVPVASLFWGMLYNNSVAEIVELIKKHKGSLDVCAAFPNVNLLCKEKLTRSESLQDWYHNLADDKTTDVTPLIFTILTNNFESCKLLLQKGANPNVVDRNGMTPLMHAVRQNEIVIVRVLMDHTYNPKEAGMKKISAGQEEKLPWTANLLERLKSSSQMTIILDGYEEDEKQDHSQVPKCSLMSSLDVNAVDSLGRTAIHHLMKTCDYGTYENVEMLEMMAGVGANLSEQDQNGKTPMDYTIETGSRKMATALQKLTGDDALKLPATPAWSDGLDFPSSQPDVDSDSQAMLKILELERGKARQPNDSRPEEEEKEDELRDVLMDEEQNVRYHASMTKVEIEKQRSYLSFYSMQLNKLPAGVVELLSHWGVINGYRGETGKKYFCKKEEAITEFEKIFKAKSGNNWADVKSFQKKPNKYALMEFKPWRAKRNSAIRDFRFDLESPVPCQLPEEIQHVVRMWTKPEILEEALKEIGVDTSIMNFGHLSREVLQSASDVLDQVSEVMKRKELAEKQARFRRLKHRLILESGDSKERPVHFDRKQRLAFVETLYDLNNQYLHQLIPYENFSHDTVRPVTIRDELEKQRKKLFDLMDLEMLNRILLGAMYRKQEIHPLDYIYRALDCKLKLLDKDDEEKRHLLQFIHNSMTGDNNVKVKAIFRMSRKGEEERLQSCCLDNHKLLWHNCNSANLLSTMKLGIPVSDREYKPAYCNLGEGIYTSPSFEVMASNGRMFGQEDSKFLLIMEIAVGKTDKPSYGDTWKMEFNSAYWSGITKINAKRELLLPTGALMPVGRLLPVDGCFSRRSPSFYIVPTQEQACLRYLVQLTGAN
ncbi:tankyrase-like protein [Acanthaster planci]|uniref:Tankyrase-like protein n=1 Tax=Acanthaster planci TaxID=133434 RepID=A0A8B7YK84_ACAPL|nr:tankyrase-like protein [Acanthaster planci]